MLVACSKCKAERFLAFVEWGVYTDEDGTASVLCKVPTGGTSIPPEAEAGFKRWNAWKNHEALETNEERIVSPHSQSLALLGLGLMSFLVVALKSGCVVPVDEVPVAADAARDSSFGTMNLQDRALLKHVSALVARRVPIKAIDDSHPRPTINSLRKKDRHLSADVEFDSDPDHLGFPPPPLGAKQIVWWHRSDVPNKGPAVIGIFWNEAGQPKVFFGIVIPRG